MAYSAIMNWAKQTNRRLTEKILLTVMKAKLPKKTVGQLLVASY